MINLIKNEFRKFGNSYINMVAIATMLFPVIFTSLFYYFDSDSFVQTWEAYINSLHLFYGIFFGALVPSFIGIFSIYYEFKEGTMKNLVSSPFSRTQIILSKIIYSSLLIVILYFFVAVLVILSGILIGFDLTLHNVIQCFKLVALPGMTAIVFIPIMIFLTLIFKNFVTPLIISFIGTIVGIPMLNIGHSYFYPWLFPSNFYFRLGNPDKVELLAPLIFLCIYLVIFFVFSIIKFRRMDFDS